jgi:hypothetical protein
MEKELKGPMVYYSLIPSTLLYLASGETIRVYAHIKRRLGIKDVNGKPFKWKIQKGEVSFALKLSKRKTHAAFQALTKLGLLRKVGEIGEEYFEFNEVTEARYARREPKTVEPKRERTRSKMEQGGCSKMERGGSQNGAGEGSQNGALKNTELKNGKIENKVKESQTDPMAEFDKLFPKNPTVSEPLAVPPVTQGK